MTAELRDWLAELGESEPLTAAEVGAAVVAVLESAEPSSLAFVDQPSYSAERAGEDVLMGTADSYQRRLEELRRLRSRVADVASARRAAELALSTQQAAGADAAVLADLAERLASARLFEARVARASQRIHAELDAFRSAIETAKARYLAADASLRIAEIVETTGGKPDPDVAQRREDLRAAGERLRALRYPGVTSSVIRQLSEQTHTGDQAAAGGAKPPPEPRHADEPVPGLLQVRADPLGSDIRILLAAEPADTMTLLAVLEGPEAVIEHGARAVRLGGELLTEIRADSWPADLDEVVLADPDEFVARFFPADDGSIARRAAVLAATTPLGRLRADLQLTLEEVAARSGLAAHRVAAIERDGLRAARVHEAIAVARALGARLELPAGSGPVAG